MKKIIELKNIGKKYDDHLVLNDFNLDIYDGEFITLLGPSGCGKTTILRLIGGFEELTSGELLFDGEEISKIPPKNRSVNTVFQNYALFPHLNVYDNIAFGLKNKKVDKEIIKKEVKKVLEIVKLNNFETRNVNKLSGGQKQRVAIARAIINKPKVLLLDEPLSALDLKLRQEMQYELKDMQKSLNITFIFVTHDQEEALTMSNRVIVMNDGVIQQIGTPEDIYNEPKNKFVASFIGESNIIKGIYKGNKKVEFLGEVFDCVDENFEIDEKCNVVIRPEDFDVIDKDKALIRGIVDDSVFKGVHYELCVLVNNIEYIVHTLENKKIGEEIGLSVDAYEIHLMKVETNEKN